MNNDTINLDVPFPKDIFIQDDFNVDRFLQEHCSKYGLHKLHKELGAYIKYLQHMMIDIVNAESSAIVNLSSDLKVLQTKFLNISAPLGQFKEEVSQIFKILNTNLNNIKHLLEQKESMVALRTLRINELRILISSQKISTILLPRVAESSIDMEIVERSVDQYILQQMYCQNCNVKEFTSQITHSTDILNQILNNVFLKSILDKNIDYITRCLQMYMMINNQYVAEQLYATKVVKPALYKIINEDTLRACDGNLSELYKKIINFINIDMKLLLSIVNKSNAISGFNFVLNSAWLEIYEQLKLNMSSIYAPGNPAIFQQRFVQTCTFLSEFEQCFLDNNQRRAFLQHPSYLTHKNLWNLPVYYEIRHLEIVQNLEQNFPATVSSDMFSNNDPTGFKLLASCHVWDAMNKCFSPEIYLPQLLDRFWKLNLQIISRYATWTQYLLKQNIPIKEEIPTHALEHNSVALINLKLKFLTYIYLDIVNFNNKFDTAFTSGLIYLLVIPKELHEVFSKSLIDPKEKFLNILASIEGEVVNSVYADCSMHVKQILQIPRLFRKTNRTTPTGPSAYLTLMSKPISNFYNSYKNDLDKIVMKRILGAIHLKIITEYNVLVENVLTSVAKTEESLRRLKKVKSGSGVSEATAITDDQKIRLQVQLDIVYYCKEAEQYADITKVNELLHLTKDTDVQN